MEYTCPVCGYSHLDEPATDDAICPSCGTQFGYHDHKKTHTELRTVWLSNPIWHSQVEARPLDWNPILQLDNLNEKQIERISIFTGDLIFKTSLGNKNIIRTITQTVESNWNVLVGDVVAAHT